MGPRGVLVGRLWTIQGIYINPDTKVKTLQLLKSKNKIQKKFYCIIHLTKGRPSNYDKRILSCEEYRF